MLLAPAKFNGKYSSGFTLIEVVISMFVIGTTLVGLVGLFVLTLRTSQETERRIVAVALANERMEMVRNLPYLSVGTNGGVPSGAIAQSETVSRNGVDYTVTTDIRYIDDPFDGVLGGGGGGGCVELSHNPSGNPGNCQDLCVPPAAVPAHVNHGDSTAVHCDGSPIVGDDQVNTDYKQVRIEASWSSPNQPKPVLLLSVVTPDGIEGGEVAGTLDFQALDSQGIAIESALVTLVNPNVSPTVSISTFTNSEGRVVLPGLPPSTQDYALSVTKNGHTIEQTYDSSASFFPDPDYLHLSALVGEVTSKTFFIDLVGTLNVTLEEGGTDIDTWCNETPPHTLANHPYTFRGTKTIGTDGGGAPVHVRDEAVTSDANGQHTHANLVWDSYSITFDGVADGCDMRETSVLLPVAINPGETIDLTLTLVKHTDVSVHVTVTDETGGVVDNASVQIVGNGYDETVATGVPGQSFFADLPQNGTYTMNVDAPGFESHTEDVTVTDTTQLQVQLTAS